MAAVAPEKRSTSDCEETWSTNGWRHRLVCVRG
jgi:hypothetical protein